MPRGIERERAILQAAIELLREVGYQSMTLDAVAARAAASKATIYRRWRDKAQLTRAALDALDARDNAAVPDTGGLRGDLVAVMEMLQKKATAAYLGMIQDLIAAARTDKALAKALKSHIENEELSPFEQVLRRAVERKYVTRHAPVKLVHDVAEAMIQRQLQAGSPFNQRFIERVVDGVLLPLLKR
jgi:AcrR family transcriptional regulator